MKSAKPTRIVLNQPSPAQPATRLAAQDRTPDTLVSLVRLMARQAAQEAFRAANTSETISIEERPT
jgi:hypothetical protein